MFNSFGIQIAYTVDLTLWGTLLSHPSHALFRSLSKLTGPHDSCVCCVGSAVSGLKGWSFLGCLPIHDSVSSHARD